MNSSNDRTISVLQLIEIAWRRKWTLVICVSIILIPILLHNRFSTPLYESKAIVGFENYNKNTIVDLDFTRSLSRGSFVTNQLQEMRTTNFAEQVYAELPDSMRQHFRFPDPIPPQFDSTRYVIEAISKQLSVGQITETDFVAITFTSEIPELAAITANTAARVLQATNLRVRRQEYASLGKFIDNQITVLSEKLQNAEEALSLYKAEENLTSIDDESKEILQRMTQAENLLNRVKADLGAAYRKLSVIDKKLGEQKKDMANAVVQITDPLTAKLKEQLVELNVQYSNLQAQGLPDDHSKMIEYRREIEQTKQKLIHTTAEILAGQKLEDVIDPMSQLKKNIEESILLKVEIQALKAQRSNLQATLKGYHNRLKELPGQELKLVRLVRDREMNDKIYVRLLEEREQARIREAAEIGNIRLVESAQVPLIPSRPRKLLNLIIGLFAGGILGVVLIFAREFTSDAPKTPEEAERILNLPVLASLPRFKTGSPASIFSRNGHRPQRLLVNHENSTPMQRDAFAYLWGALELNLPASPYVLMVTSACPGEGKSTIAANLCLTAAQHGRNTVLIDGDLRRPTLHEKFGVAQAAGLTQLVNEATALLTEHTEKGNPGKAPLADGRRKSRLQTTRRLLHAAVKRTLQQPPSLDMLRILAAGDLVSKPHVVWSSPIMTEIFLCLKKTADLIVIDSPPALGIPDACFIVRHSDSILFCVEAAKTDSKALHRTLKFLDKANSSFLGVAFNKVNPAAIYGGYGHYKYYLKQYGRMNGSKQLVQTETV